ncbi:ABC transporter permease [Paenibacillus assamensis]|uniref:ABC transporter permease n=1 Tax=Paenibacillus assamensis TaxID=311244 RepID=UPI0003FCCF96|nr:ABC-2 family transporter protein [Paenibacillus assamensis]
MRRIDKYIYSYKVGFQSATEYRMDFILSIFASIFPIFVQYFVWKAVFSATPVYNGYTFNSMMLYIIVATVVSRFVSAGFEYEISSDIKNGHLSRFITMPVSYLFFRVFRFLGQKIIHLVICALILICLSFIMKMLSFELVYHQLFLFIISIILALILNFIIFYIVSTISFWMAEIWGVVIALRLVINIASGGILPIAVFGESIASVLNVLPFKYTISFPLSILLDDIPLGEVMEGFALQCVWIAVFAILAKIAWDRGMKKYIAAGG